MFNTTLGACYDPRSFTTKAGAMSFAICYSFADGKVDYEEAQKLFDFICKNVNLPDVEKDSMEGLAATLGRIVQDKAVI